MTYKKIKQGSSNISLTYGNAIMRDSAVGDNKCTVKKTMQIPLFLFIRVGFACYLFIHLLILRAQKSRKPTLVSALRSLNLSLLTMAALYETFAFARASKTDVFKPIKIKRGDVGADDVKFDILFCGICHTDIHFAEDSRGTSKWPLVPGHELAGVVTAVGANVESVGVGDRVGVGCIVDSCMKCRSCDKSEEQYCYKGMTMTYSSDIKHGHIATDTGFTYGGYSGSITLHHRYVIR